MIIVELPNFKVGVTFQHRPYKKPTFDKATSKHFMNGVTYCEIHKIGPQGAIDTHVLSVGIGICKVPDTFTKKIGRKHSLTSALSKHERGDPTRPFIFNRIERERIWHAYWATCEPQLPPITPVTPVVAAAIDLIVRDGVASMENEGSAIMHHQYGADISGNVITGP